jgi:hypothetical protein
VGMHPAMIMALDSTLYSFSSIFGHRLNATYFVHMTRSAVLSASFQHHLECLVALLHVESDSSASPGIRVHLYTATTAALGIQLEVEAWDHAVLTKPQEKKP